MSSPEERPYSPGMKPGYPGWKPRVLGTRPAGARGQKQSGPNPCPCLKARQFQGGKHCKTSRKFISKDTAPCVGAHTGEECIYHNQKQGRNTHPERKGVGILSNKEACSKSEARYSGPKT